MKNKKQKPISKVTQKQNLIAGTLFNQAIHNLGELDIPYVLLLQGQTKMFSNVDQNNACRIVENQNILNNMIQSHNAETELDAMIAYPKERE